MKISILFCFFVVILLTAPLRSETATHSVGTPGPNVDGAAVYSPRVAARPAYDTVSATDTRYNSTVERIAGNSGTAFPFSGVWGLTARHHYSKDQPWNSDGTLIALDNSDGSATPNIVYLNASTYAVASVRCPAYSRGDDRWNVTPGHASERVNVKGTLLEWYDVVACVQTKRITLPFSAHYIGQAEGNTSADGRYIALTNSTDTRLVLVDMQTGTIGPVTDIVTGCGLPSCAMSHSSVSPSGNYVLVSYDGDTHAVWDTNLVNLTITRRVLASGTPECSTSYKPSLGILFNLGHADMATNPYGVGGDVVVGQRRSGCTTLAGKELGRVVMVNLSDGKVTSLTKPSGEASVHHVSMRATGRPGWAYVTYYRVSGKRFSGELVAVKLDGSYAVERLGLTHSSEAPYHNEAHGVPSPDGTRVIFASAWDVDCKPCGTSSSVQDYVVVAQ